MTKFTEEHIWKILTALFKKSGLVANQIESFDDFINFGIQEIIDQSSTITLPNYTLKFGEVYIAPPQVIEEDRALTSAYPNDARRRDLNYDSAIHVDLTETYRDNISEPEIKHHRRIVIGRMPIMVGSSACNLSKLNEDEKIKAGECMKDPGGYFIIKGHERVVVAQMRTTYNQVFVLRQKSTDKYKWIAETRSMSDETGHSVLIQAMIGNDDRSIDFSLPYVKDPIPVGVVFKAIGFVDDQDIVDLIGLKDQKSLKYIKFILRDSFFCRTQSDALEEIGKYTMHSIADTTKKEDYIRQVVESDSLPHLGISPTKNERALFLGRMIRKLILTHIGQRAEDDRDNYTNKRVETAGNLMYDIFRNLFKKYTQFMKAQLEKRKQRPDALSIMTRIKSITKGLHQCLATGNWGVQKNASYVRSGVSQILDRMTYCSSLSHLRRVIIPTGKEGKNTAMRQIHGSSFGFVCPAECFHPDTKILMWSGDIKRAEEIKEGDILIDEKGNPVRVKSTCEGYKAMYTIVHGMKNFENYTVTDNHILTMKATKHKTLLSLGPDTYGVVELTKDKKFYRTVKFFSKISATNYLQQISDDNIVDISIEDYLNLEPNFQSSLKMFKGCANWPEVETENNPYSVGFEGKITREYVVNSREKRLLLLAGAIDSGDALIGNTFAKVLFEDTKRDYSVLIFLAESLGLGYDIRETYGMIEITLYGDCIRDLPCKKKVSISPNFSDVLMSSFQLKEEPVQRFVGWQLEGNGRFLLRDFTVTHNTPEGGKVGVVLNYALTAKVTKKISKSIVRSVIEGCKSIIPVDEIKYADTSDYSCIVLNGSVIGFAQNPEEVVEELRSKRRIGLLEKEVSISYDIVENEIRVLCDEGRFTRPLLALQNNKLIVQPQEKYKWRTLLREGAVVYLDASEIEESVIAMTKADLKKQQCDYAEIHPFVMLGIMAAMIPFSDHSQSPRNCYQSSMGKQALGIPALSYNRRTDTLLHVLHYPQKPLVYTKAAEILKINEMPSGVNAIVAIACYSGYNQEDSVMLNLSSIQRGLFCLTSYHTISCTEKKRDTYSFEEICLPPMNSEPSIKPGEKGYFRRNNNANYSLLGSDGIIRPRERFENGKWVGEATTVRKGDVLVGKAIVTGNKNGEETRIDDSVIVQPGEEGVIDRIHTVITPNGYKLVKIVIRVTREPTLGDKLASRAAQKGTIGMVYRQEDMPYTASGICPDIIINPMCMPSRMTINQLIECALGKACTIEGRYGDATPFSQYSTNAADKLVERMSKNIQDYGFQPQGWEVMYNGMTGEQMNSMIFMGPTYYQRLKHMVDDKMHARAQGSVTVLTRQPREGRSRDGGLRFGEMERDCQIAHGNSAMLKERLFLVSDPFKISVCDTCGVMTSTEKECQVCKGDKVSSCNFPYASKLLHQELTTMGLKVSIRPDQK